MTTHTSGAADLPEALRLADFLYGPFALDWTNEAAAELRRLHSENERLTALAAGQAVVPALFQERVQPWLLECFGAEIAADRAERNHRFLEESLELVQALGCTASEAHQLVDYVFGRPVGEPAQEVGGVMVTLAALCLASGLDMHGAGETELARIWTKVEKIRAKQAAKPKHSPLPEFVARPAPPAMDDPGPFLDDDGRTMVGSSHHYTADNIRALVAEYKALESGAPEAVERYSNSDHRARAGVLWRVISALADEVPFAPAMDGGDAGSADLPDRVGVYAWASGTSFALVLVDKRPSKVAAGGQFNAQVIESTKFYDGCPVTSWGRDGKWTLLHDCDAARAAQKDGV